MMWKLYLNELCKMFFLYNTSGSFLFINYEGNILKVQPITRWHAQKVNLGFLLIFIILLISLHSLLNFKHNSKKVM